MEATITRPAILADYEAFDRTLRDQPEAVRELRRAGLRRFEEVGFPKVSEEEWRHTNVAKVARGSFRRAVARPAGDTGVERERLAPFLVPECDELVFVDGRFAPALSSTPKLPPGAFAGSLAVALRERPELVLPHLGRYAEVEKNPFVALNAAHVEDGAFVYVPRGAVLERPLHLLFVGRDEGGDGHVAAYPRNLFVVEETAQATLLETYGGFGGERYLTCAVTEIVAAAGAVVDHYKLEQESIDAFHLATQQIHLGRDVNFFTHSISHGGELVRNDIRAVLAAPGIHCTLNGLYLGRGKQHIDHHMWIDHAAPRCHSYELFKGILEDEARAVFNGLIHVHKDAQKTDAKQSNRNLLLSQGALVHSNPQLRIYADDVRCTHGSTTGHLDEDAVFYLRSRGIGEEAAKSLLTYAFAGEVLQEIRLETVRKDLEEFLFTRLPKGDIVRQAV